jgi:hypothetical protein
MRKTLVFVLMVSALVLAPVAASAQIDIDNYIPGGGGGGGGGGQGPAGQPGAPGASPCQRIIDLGTIFEGESRSTLASCPFQGSSTVSLALNGTTYGSTTANGAGAVPVTVTVTSDGVALARPVLAVAGLQLAQAGGAVARINANGVVHDRPANVGSNLLRLSGTSTSGGPGTVDILFNIATRGKGGAAGGALPRTGAMLVRWSAAGVALTAIGIALVMTDRRRRRAFDAGNDSAAI